MSAMTIRSTRSGMPCPSTRPRQGRITEWAASRGTVSDVYYASLEIVFIVHGARKFLDRVGGPTVAPVEQSTTALGPWYATVLFWKPHVALFVNEATLLPVLVPFAPAATVVDRFPGAVAAALRGHGIGPSFIEHEVAEMTEHRVARTTNRSVIGIMNEFASLAGAYRSLHRVEDLMALTLRLAETPCGPLYARHVSPDRELAAFAARHPG